MVYITQVMTKPSAPHTLMKKVLRPLVRLLLRNGVAFADFSTVARRVFVEVASEDFGIPGRKQSVSRVSVLTGVNRKEVKRLLEEPEEQEEADNNRAARVVSGWMRDKDFQTRKGKPRKLNWGDATEGGFEELVKRYSGDMTARAILDELLRVGAITLDKKKTTVTLVANGYVPVASNKEMLRESGNSLRDLLNTIDHNCNINPDLVSESSQRLQLTVAYDDVPADSVELFRNLSDKKSHELLAYLDQFLSTQDRSVNPSVKGDGRYRTGLGIYFFEEPLDPERDPRKKDPEEAQDHEK